MQILKKIVKKKENKGTKERTTIYTFDIIMSHDNITDIVLALHSYWIGFSHVVAKSYPIIISQAQ
jgi:hypothetical protein